MLKNYLKIAFRNLWRQKTFSLLNLLGLCLGITAALVLFFYIQFELSYESFHEKKDRIFRVTEEFAWAGNYIHFPMNSGLLGPRLEKDLPPIEWATRIRHYSGQLVNQGNKKLYLEQSYFVDSSFLKVFTYPLKTGNPNNCLKNPNSAVLTIKTAEKIFGTTENIMGKTFKLENRYTMKVTGLMQEIPDNTELTADAFFSISSLDPKEAMLDSWGSFSNLSTFVLLEKNVDKDEFEKQAEAHMTAVLTKEDWDNPEELTYGFHLQPITEMRLYSDHLTIGGEGMNIRQIYVLSFVALFILLIASINYINLTTARAVHRAKEVGVRKVLGSYKQQLMGQFLTESTLIVLSAFLISLALVEFLMPLFAQLLDEPIKVSYRENMTALGMMLLGVLVLSLLSGLYPAFILASFQPVKVLKGKFAHSKTAIWLRKGLVVFQFAISMIFIISTWLFYQQLNFMKDQDLGLDKTQIINLSISNEDIIPKSNLIQDKLLENPKVVSVTSSNTQIGHRDLSQSTINFILNDEKQNIQVRTLAVDADYLEVMQLTLKEGHFFDKKFKSESEQSVVINETLAQKLGGVEKAIGVKLEANRDNNPYKVIGVVKDFHLQSLHDKIRPSVIFYDQDSLHQIYVRYQAENPDEMLTAVKSVYESFDQLYPVEVEFVDESYARRYRTDERQSQLFLIFTGLTILIACLGLFGLAAYTVQQKTKEIGIRKVLGASVSQILTFTSKDFMILIGISSVIAMPLAFAFMQNWLTDFAYQIELLANWHIFGLAVLVAFLVALLTILTQAFRATQVNPIEVLKDE